MKVLLAAMLMVIGASSLAHATDFEANCLTPDQRREEMRERRREERREDRLEQRRRAYLAANLCQTIFVTPDDAAMVCNEAGMNWEPLKQLLRGESGYICLCPQGFDPSATGYVYGPNFFSSIY